MLNKVILIGNLGADPEIRFMPTGGSVANISLATTRRWKDRDTRERRDATEWHRVIFFNRLAEIAGEYLKKGTQVYIEGRIQTRKWQDKNGQDRYSTEIIAEKMQILGSRPGGTAPQPAGTQTMTPAAGYDPVPMGSNNSQPPPVTDDFDDDIPF